jgi:thioesterase domain-containing protein
MTEAGEPALSDVKRALLELRLREERARRAGREARLAPLVPLQPRGGRPPFYCVHASAGSAFPYIGLAQRLGEDQPSYGLESPGLDGARPPLETFEEMAACYVAAITEQQPRGPYRIGGWSIGAIVALEIARQLAGAGREVAALVLIDTAHHDPGDTADALKCVRWFVKDLAGMSGTETPDVEEVLLLPAERRPAALRQLLVERGLLPVEMDAITLERRLAVHLANTIAFFNHRLESYYGQAVVLCAQASNVDTRWRELVRGGAVYEVVPGDHYGILRPPNVDVLAARVRAALA